MKELQDLSLSKKKSELLGSKLKQWKLPQSSINIKFFQNRHLDFALYFFVKSHICFCTDINALVLSLDKECVASEWKLFINLNKTNLKMGSS